MMRIDAREFKSALVWGMLAALLSIFWATPVRADEIDVPGDYATIQKAIDAASPGDVINVAAGTYTENIVIDKRLSLIGEGSSAGGTIITQYQGNIGDSKVGVVQIEASGISEAEPLLLKDIRIEPDQLAGISVGRLSEATDTNIAYLEMDNLHVVGTNSDPGGEQERGFYVDLTSSVEHLFVTNCAFDDLAYGWYLHKEVSADTSTVRSVDVSNTTFNHNRLKGLYAEKLSDSTFTNCTVKENGFSSSGVPSYFLPWLAGFDINLKAGAYQNISFVNCTFADNALGGAKEGAGLMIKARDDGSIYSAHPATLTNVTIEGSAFTGNERGIRFGEPGKNNTGPTGVVVRNAAIYGNRQVYTGTDGSAYGGLINQTQAEVKAEENWWGDAEGPLDNTGETELDPADTCLTNIDAAKQTDGDGDAVTEDVDYCPWLSRPWTTTPAVGGATVPLNKIGLLAPWIVLTAALMGLTALVAYIPGVCIYNAGGSPFNRPTRKRE
jgi:hypothetical protein